MLQVSISDAAIAQRRGYIYAAYATVLGKLYVGQTRGAGGLSAALPSTLAMEPVPPYASDSAKPYVMRRSILGQSHSSQFH
jgi:hypothetical protein